MVWASSQTEQAIHSHLLSIKTVSRRENGLLPIAIALPLKTSDLNLITFVVIFITVISSDYVYLMQRPFLSATLMTRTGWKFFEIGSLLMRKLGKKVLI